MFPLPRTDLSYGLSDGYAESGVAIEHRNADLDIGNLPVEVSRHQGLAEKHDAVQQNPDNLSQVAATLHALKLAHLSDRGIADLSGGQAQMVAVAQTIVRAPDVILLDEPTSALDLHHQLSIMTSIRSEMQRRKPVVIAALHDLNLAAKFCDRLVLLRDGVILADGPPEQILALPEIGETYRVKTDLERTGRGALYVDARLPA